MNRKQKFIRFFWSCTLYCQAYFPYGESNQYGKDEQLDTAYSDVDLDIRESHSQCYITYQPINQYFQQSELKMGPPPKYLIQRKLVRSMIKKVIPKNPLLPQQYWDGLFKCWKVNGIGSTRCVDQQMKYDFAKQSQKSFKQKIEKMGIKSAVTAQLSRPSYWHQIRGRHYQDRMKNRYIIDLTDKI